MKGNVPMLQDIEVGVDFLHSARSYDIHLEVTLPDRDALDVRIRMIRITAAWSSKHMHAVAESSVSVDWEV